MKLIAGLGNPGSKYAGTRHNIGFIILDYFADQQGIIFKEGKGDWFECSFSMNGEIVYMLKPTTYMNNSGTAVKEFCDLHEIRPENILIVYDDFQLPIGTIRVRNKGSDGGHNGISSVIYHMNTDQIPRMRIGIGSETALKKDQFIDFVLSRFTEEEAGLLIKIMPDFSDCIKSFITDSIKVTMNTYNRSFLISGESDSSGERKENKTETGKDSEAEDKKLSQ
ncbi:MAG: aminoacyl-tRNA hydrolase [Bacteroidetes bacterium]|nr:aminoacyl-tRNA hydrolase [Bacteroidota bacterium]